MVKFQVYLNQKMQKLYPLDEPSALVRHFLKKQLIRIIIFLLGGVIFSLTIFFNNGQQELYNKNKIIRPAYGKADKQVTLSVDSEDGILQNEQVTFNILPKEYNYKEFIKEVEKGKNYVNKTFLKENKCSEEVNSDLFFPEKIEDSFLQLEWNTEEEEIISSVGQVNNFWLKNKKLITITVIFLYGKYQAAYSLMVCVCPPDLSKQETYFYHLEQAISREEMRRGNNMVSLPEEIDGKKVLYSESKIDWKVFFFIPFLVCLFVFEGAKEELKRNEKRRKQQLEFEYPEIMNQIAILLSAGMPIRGVFGKLTEQYEEKRKIGKRKYGYEEVAVTYYEMQNGVPELEALERMGMRIQIMSYRKLMALLVQNARKGSKDLINLLEIEAYSACEQRKEMVKTLGEEAGTKLLFPMLIMLMIVLAIVIVPVFMTI